MLRRLFAFYLPTLVASNQQQYGLLGIAFTLYNWLSATTFIIVMATAIGAVLAEDPGRLAQLICARGADTLPWSAGKAGCARSRGL